VRGGFHHRLAWLAVLAGPALAAPEEFAVDQQHTFPMFEVEHLGISTQRGRFDRTKGRIVLDRDAGTGSIDVSIDAASVSTGNSALDAVIRGEDFLDAARHPALTFRADAIVFENGLPRRADGELGIAGMKRPVQLRVTRFACTRLPFLVRYTCGADIEASLRRSEFGMTAYAGFVGDEVKLRIQAEAVRVERVEQPGHAEAEGALGGTITGGGRWK
jgi:polyisoprenoid-binding protein YceI